MKTFRWLVPVLALLLLLSVGAGAVWAAGTSPVGAPFVDNATHELGPNTTTWYRFDYAGNHSQITITLVGAKDKGLAFQVYPPTFMADWWKHDGVGAGNPKDNDLLWTGNAHEAGIWYIKVINKNPAPVSYQLVVKGDYVTFSALLPSISTINPTTVSLDNVDPNKALPADSTARVIPAKTTLWYRFFYSGDHSQVKVLLPNGADNRLRFHVHTPTQMLSWWNKSPVGQSNNQGGDLVWNGNSHEGGWWYVEVINENPYAIGFGLNVTGQKVWFNAPTVTTVTPTLPSIAVSLDNADPNKAFIVDSNMHVIPANATLWYRYSYSGSNYQATLTVPNGNDEHLRVHVHTPDQMKTWWNTNPVGQAMPKGDDLVWSGNAVEGGWWYVEVINENPSAVAFQLLLQIQERQIK